MISENQSRKVLGCLLMASLVSTTLFAQAAGDQKTIGTIATSVASSFQAIGQLILGIAFVAGLGFGVTAIFKFKQHKDNPQQTPVGQPVALMAISAALVFLPGFYNPLGATMGVSSAGGFTGSGQDALPGAKKP